MNLLLTNYCNRSCAYCFAKGKIMGEKHVNFDPKDLSKIISFFRRSKLKKIDIIGGEPTLHPHFEVIINKLLENNFRIQIFTNGIMPQRVLVFIKTIPKEKFHSMININSDYLKSERKKLEQTLQTLGSSASLGLNIDSLDFSYSFIFDLIKKYNLNKYLRIGIAQPILEADNRFVPFHKYQDLTPRVMRLVRKADRQDVAVMFDCGFTLCMFTPAQLGRLYLARTGITFHCNPVPDIGPDLSAWHCFPLSAIENVRLEQFENEKEIIRYYFQRMAPYRRMGAADLCRNCRYLLRGQCSGGCLAHTINRFKTG